MNKMLEKEIDESRFVPMQDTYIQWKEKLKESRYLYLCAMSGYGKTVNAKYYAKKYAKHSYYLRAYRDDFISELSSILESKGDRRTVPLIIIDDLQWLPKESQTTFAALITSDNAIIKNFRFFLLSRANLPTYLKPYLITGQLTAVNAAGLVFNKPQFEKLLELNGMTKSKKEIELLSMLSHDYPIAASFAVSHLKALDVMPTLTERSIVSEVGKLVLQDVYDYFDFRLFPNWKKSIKQFILEMAGFESFTAEMADEIRGTTDSRLLIDEIMELGSFMKSMGKTVVVFNSTYETAKKYAAVSSIEDEKAIINNRIPAKSTDLEEEYSIFPFFRYYLLNRQPSLLSKEHYRLIYSRAAVWFEKRGNIERALCCYERAGQKDKIKEVIVRNNERFGGFCAVEEIAVYIDRLKLEEMKDSVELLATAALLEAERLHIETCENYLKQLEELMNRVPKKDPEHKQAMLKVLYLKLFLPHRGSRKLLKNLLQCAKLLNENNITMQKINTNLMVPSVISGVKDFSIWCRHAEKIYELIKEPLENLLGDRAQGLVDCGLGEVYYYQNRSTEAVKCLIIGQSAAVANNNILGTFVANEKLSQIFLSEGSVDTATSILLDVMKMAEKDGNRELIRNIKASMARIYLLTGETDKVDEWLQEAPNEYNDFFVTHAFLYLIKVAAYIMKREKIKALVLIGKLEEFCKKCDRPFLWIKITLLKSVIMYENGEDWKDIFVHAVKKAASYHFVRTVADEGNAIYPLLIEAIEKDYFSEFQIDEFLEEVRVETEQMRMKYPEYLKCEKEDVFNLSDMENKILSMITEGKANKEIAERLCMTIHGVKYHLTHLYKKMKVSNRAEAIVVAKDYNLV